MSLKRLSRHVTEKATLMGDMSLKRLPQYVTEKATPTCHLHFSVMQTLQWLSVLSNHLHFALITCALTPCLASTTRYYEPI
jgi:hypothetical protein